MGKGKKPGKPGPRKARKPAHVESTAAEEAPEPRIGAAAEVVPSRVQPTPMQEPLLLRVVHMLRAAAGAVLDIADAAADAITRGREGRV